MTQPVDVDFDVSDGKRRIAPVVEHSGYLGFTYLAYAAAAGADAVKVLSGAYAALILHRPSTQVVASHYSAVDHQLHVGIDRGSCHSEVTAGQLLGKFFDSEVSVEVKYRVENRAPFRGVAQLLCSNILRKRFGGFGS